MRHLLFILPLALLVGCSVLDMEDTGSLRVVRDENRRIVKIEFVQPMAAKEASTIVFNVETNGNISGEAYMGTQYNTRGIAETFRNLRVWHYAGVGLVLLGVCIIVFKKSIPGLDLVSPKAPWLAIGGGVLCAVIGHVVPTYGKQIAIAAVVIGAVVAIYVLWVRKPDATRNP